MRSASLLNILLLSAVCGLAPLASARAIAFNCGSAPGFQSHGRSIDVRTFGYWESLGFGHSQLSYELQYGIDCTQAGSCWAEEGLEETGVIANWDYSPRRYTDYQQFTLAVRQTKGPSFLLLPEASTLATGSFQAILMLDGVRGVYGASTPLWCQGETMSSLSSTVAEDAAAEISRADRILQEEFGFGGLHLQTNYLALQKQMQNGDTGSVSLSKATQLAIAVTLGDFVGVESPLQIAADAWASNQLKYPTGKLTLTQKQAVRNFLRQQLQDPKTSLALYLGQTVKGLSYPPEQGESADDNWIFVLRIPTLSDHLYWVIVDRQGQRAPYLYGFN